MIIGKGISGYSDPEYLRDALRMGASDYIYKPIRLDELKKTLGQVKAKLDQQKATRMLLEKSKPLLAERFLHSWFHGLLDDKASIRAKLDLLGLRFPESGGLFAMGFQPEWEVFPENGEAEKCQIVLETILKARFKDILTCAEDTGIVALLPAGDRTSPEQLETALQDIVGETSRSLSTPVAVAVSRRHEAWQEAAAAVQEAVWAMTHQGLAEENRILFYQGEDSTDPASVDLLGSDLVESYVLSGNKEMLNRTLEEICDDRSHDTELTRKQLVSFILRMDLALEYHGINAVDSLLYSRKALGHPPIGAMKTAAMNLVRQACDLVVARRDQSYSPVVERVLRIIRARYNEHLSVNTIAEQVNYSPAHLSTLFKREVGLVIVPSTKRHTRFIKNLAYTRDD